MSERAMVSNDPKDPAWRFLVWETPMGLFEIVEEELTSGSPTALRVSVTNRILMTRAQAEWMLDALASVLRENP